MSANFDQLIQRVYEGDPEAATTIVREYEPEIRRIVRHRLRGKELQRVVDSLDICQSVFGKFFVRAALGQFQIDEPKDLVKLLTKMAVNRIIDKHRSENSLRHLASDRMAIRGHASGMHPGSMAETPESIAEYKELLACVREKMTEQERQISQFRTDGKSWLEISELLSESPHALRKRLDRACQRVFAELNLADD